MKRTTGLYGTSCLTQYCGAPIGLRVLIFCKKIYSVFKIILSGKNYDFEWRKVEKWQGKIQFPDTEVTMCNRQRESIGKGGCTLRKKSTSEHLFWCFRLSQIEDSIEYLEGPNSTWKDHDRNLGVQMVLYLWQPGAPKKVLWSTFFLRVYSTDVIILLPTF